MRIGILGSGDVGHALARGFAAVGHEVMLGSGHPERDREAAPAHVGSFADAADHADVAVLAVRWSGLADVLTAPVRAALASKILIDTSNPLRYEGPRPVALETPPEGSAAEHVAASVPHARVVKAFNVVGAALMVNPQVAGGPPDMFICGDDVRAKEVVADLCAELRYPAFDVGPLRLAGLLECMAMLWISIAMSGAARGHAFKLLRDR